MPDFSVLLKAPAPGRPSPLATEGWPAECAGPSVFKGHRLVLSSRRDVRRPTRSHVLAPLFPTIK
jgi:hypothetical protein